MWGTRPVVTGTAALLLVLAGCSTPSSQAHSIQQTCTALSNLLHHDRSSASLYITEIQGDATYAGPKFVAHAEQLAAAQSPAEFRKAVSQLEADCAAHGHR